jgi:acetyltransferase-like isoleucine patch superfamily enzyme
MGNGMGKTRHVFNRELARMVGLELRSWTEALLSTLPGRAGDRTRRLYWCWLSDRNAIVGHGFESAIGLVIKTGIDGIVNIGNDVHLNYHVIIDPSSSGRITIGDRTLIGPNTVIRASNHSIDYRDITHNGHKPGIINIGSDVWIGANCVVLPNVSIGNRTIIGAGSVVVDSLPTDVVACGVPARVVKERRYELSA